MSNSINRLYIKIKDSLSKNSGEKNNQNIYYNRTLNSEEKKYLLDLKFKPINANNNSLIKTKTDKNDKTLKRPSFHNPNRNITHNRLLNTLGIQTKKTNIKLNLIVNEKTLFQNYKFNKKKKNKPIREINSTFKLKKSF